MSIFVSEGYIRRLAWEEACERQKIHDDVYHGPTSFSPRDYTADWERIKIQQRIAALEMRLGWLSNPKTSPLRAEDV